MCDVSPVEVMCAMQSHLSGPGKAILALQHGGVLVLLFCFCPKKQRAGNWRKCPGSNLS